MKLAVRRCLDLLYPPKCVFCDALLSGGEEYFCRSCGEKIPMAEEEKLCRTGTYFDRCVAPLYYEGMVRDSFLDYKFHEKSWRAGVYAAFLVPYLKKEFPDIDAITWVPLGRRNQRDRGYDQSRLLAQEIAKAMNLPYEMYLEKVRHTRQQSRIEAPEERRANVLGAYAMKKNAEVAGRRLLLVDDIFTTGSTMEECSRVLMSAGASCVHGAVLAQAVGKVARESKKS